MTVFTRRVSQPSKDMLARWFAKRAPKSDQATLNLRNVYIFFSREGGLFVLLLMITFIAGVNYGNNLVLGLCFYLASVWLISFHVTFAHISGLQVELLEVTMAEVGAPVWVTLQVRSSSRQPRRQLRFSFDQPSSLVGDTDADSTHKNKKAVSTKQDNDQTDMQVLLPRLDDEHVIRLPIYTNQRGELELPRLQIKTVYPLGIMRAWSYVYFARTAWVYPKPVAFDWQPQYLAARNDDLPTGGQYAQGQDDFDRLDHYIEGESLARVSWAHVARGQGMFTKHFVDPIGHEQYLAYENMPAAHHEQKLSEMAYGVMMLGQSQVPFQMQLPADNTMTTGQGEPFVQACLLRLAKAP